MDSWLMIWGIILLILSGKKIPLIKFQDEYLTANTVLASIYHKNFKSFNGHQKSQVFNKISEYITMN